MLISAAFFSLLLGIFTPSEWLLPLLRFDGTISMVVPEKCNLCLSDSVVDNGTTSEGAGLPAHCGRGEQRDLAHLPLWFHCCCLILGTTSRFFEATLARGAAEQPVAGSLQQWEDINPATLFRLHRFIRPGAVPLGRGR